MKVHRVVTDDVVHVAQQQDVRVQSDVDLGQGGADVLFGVQVDAASLASSFWAPVSVRCTLRLSESVS